MIQLRLLFLLLTLTGSTLFAASLTFYVAPNGNDRWSGQLAAPDRAGNDGPLASMPAALQRVRKARADSQSQLPVDILLRGGTYGINEPVVLRPEDSGATPDSPLTIAAYKREQPVLSGGLRITGWKRAGDKPDKWQVELPEVRAGKWHFRQLFIDGKRKTRARTPNDGFFVTAGEYLRENPVKFKYRDGDIQPAWAGSDAELIALHKWIDIGQGILSDMGAVYTLGIQKGSVVRNNLIHDVNAHSYGGWGLYTDEGSTGIVLESNLVFRCKSASFHQHYGRDNVIRNNVLAFAKEYQLMRSREEEHNSFTFERNIVYLDSGDLLGSNWSNDHFTMDHNLYWDARPNFAPETLRFKGATLAEWRQRGHDRNSRVADPQFVAPDKYNFQFKRTSPAFELGINPIRLDQVGVRRNYRKQVRDTE